MKRIFVILTAASLVFGLAACAKAPAPETTAAPETVEETTAAPKTTAAESAAATEAAQTEAALAEKEGFVGMANPMVPVDSDAFDEQLGFHIDAAQIDPDAKCFIISGKLAHIVWTQKNVNNEDVEFVLRATKDAELAPTMHGIHDSNMSEPVVTEVPLTDTKMLELTFTEAKTEKYGIYTWKDGQIFYSLTYNKDMSQMALAEVLDRVMDVTGIRWHKEHITALPGITELDNCMVNAYFDKTKIKHENGVYTAEFECYEKELFDMVEIHLMQEGDTITIEDDQVIEIKKIEKNGNNGHIVINGGVDFEDGLVLAPGDGGTYFVFGLDDCPSYHFIGKKELELAKDVVLTDTADIENKCVEKKVEGDEAVVKHLQENAYIDPPARGCMICIDGGKVVEIQISYVP